MHYHRSLLITGGAGFIGSHVVRLLANKYPQYHIVCLDKLTYAGNLKTLEDVASLPTIPSSKRTSVTTSACVLSSRSMPSTVSSIWRQRAT